MRFRKRLSLVTLFAFIMAGSSFLVNPYYASSNQHEIIAKTYTKSQTAFDSNACTVEGDNSTNSLNCVNISPQTLGKGNLVDVDNAQVSVIEQMGKRGPAGPQGPPGPPGPGAENKLHVVWQDNTVFPAANNEVFYKRSIDGGLAFEETQNLSNNPTTSEEVEVATVVSGQNVYVIWRDNNPGNFDIFFRRSIDGGVNFGPTENLSNNPGNSLNSHIAVSGNNVYVVWMDDTTGNNEILFRGSTDSGATFDPTENLSNNIGNSVNPQITASGNDVHVVWQDPNPSFFDVFYKRSTDNGASFDPVENISNNLRDSEIAQISSSGNNVYVVWNDILPPGNSEIFFRRSTDRGDTFAATDNLSNNEGSSAKPQIAS